MSAPRNPQPLSLSDLSTLVQANDLDGIRKVIAQEKTAKGRRWVDTLIKAAARDAILLGQIETVRFLLTEGLSPNEFAYSSGNTGFVNSLLSFAATAGHLPIVQLLVEAGAEIKPRDSYYNTGDDSGIRAAVEANHPDIVDYLLKRGATACGSFGGMMTEEAFLERATTHAYHRLDGSMHIVESLIHAGADIDIEPILNLAEKRLKKYLDSYRYHLRSNANSDNTHKRTELEAKIVNRSNEYQFLVKTLMDYAMGIDFSEPRHSSFSGGEFGGLSFIKGLDISSVNFIGVSVGGFPVTHAMLTSLNLIGADNAIVTMNGLGQMQDDARRETLHIRFADACVEQGQYVASTGVANLVPLWRAAAVGDMNAVKARLAAGVDPNEQGGERLDKKQYPIVLAAKAGHLAIVQALAKHPAIDRQSFVTAVEAARLANQDAIVAEFESLQDINA